MPVIKLFANLRQIVKSPSVAVSGSTVGEAVGELCKISPALNEKLFQNGELRPLYIISLNGRHIDLIKGLDTEAQITDEIAIFPPIAGGSLELFGKL